MCSRLPAGAVGYSTRFSSLICLTTGLHFSLAQERLHPAFAALDSSVNKANEGPDCTVHAANALWGQQGYGFLDDFLTLNREYYGARFREVGFVIAAAAFMAYEAGTSSILR